jgi:hypothetical protein
MPVQLGGCIHRVNQKNASTEFLPVKSYPGTDARHFDMTTAVYVEKLNRVYMFGGTVDGMLGTFHRKIWYIDLPTFS